MVEIKPIQINIPVPVLKKIDRAIDKEGLAANRSEFVRIAINEKLDRIFSIK